MKAYVHGAPRLHKLVARVYTSQVSCCLLIASKCFSHYFAFQIVACIKSYLFTKSREELTKVKQKYDKKVPEPMNRQFLERNSKVDALECHRKRKERVPELFPSSKALQNWQTIPV